MQNLQLLGCRSSDDVLLRLILYESALTILWTPHNPDQTIIKVVTEDERLRFTFLAPEARLAEDL